MNANFYQQVIANAPFGYVHYKAVREPSGLVTDYVFVEGNKVFEAFAGATSAQSVGKSIANILMKWDMGGDWLESFKKVTLISSGQVENLEFYAKALRRWYSVQISNIQPDHYAAVFTDITQSKQNEQRIKAANIRVEKQRAATAKLLLYDVKADANINQITAFGVRLLAETIGTARASIWMFDETKTQAHCIALYEVDGNKISDGAVLYRKDFPDYFHAMCTATRIDASDAQTDPRTKEFTEIYLKPLNIGAMLDVGIILNGDIIGLICLEHIGGTRKWEVDEEAFASTGASIYAQMLVAIQQHESQVELNESKMRLVDLAKQQHLEQELREQQERFLLEISTPITQLWKNILLLPLVGGMSSRRAQDILTTTLHKISQSQAKVFILDISGVSVVDTSVANGFIRLAKATQLMGCQTIISGISPAIAQTIVELGIQIDELLTTGIMQDALVRALQITGLHISQNEVVSSK